MSTLDFQSQTSVDALSSQPLAFPLQPLEANVAKLRPHGLSGVKLQRQHPLGECQIRLIIGEIENQAAVEPVADMVTLRPDHDIIPIVEFHEALEFIRIDECADHLLPVGLPRCLLAHLTDSPPLAPFVINEAWDVRKCVFVANLMLVAPHHPLVAGRTVGDVPRAILDAGVVEPAIR